MPIGVVVESNKKFELKTAPPDGFVVIRRMTYGESLYRKDIMAQIAMQMRKAGSTDDSMTVQMALMQEKVSLWEFANLVVEHNLTDAVSKPLDFKNPAHVKALRGQLGDEIQKYINDINSFEDDEEIKNSNGG